jgi:hypothetical protein
MTTASFIKLSPRRTSSDLRTSMETARLPAVPALASLHPMRRLRTWMAGVALLAVTAAALVVASVPMDRLGALLALGVLLLGVAIQLLVPQTRPERERWRPSLDHTRRTAHARDQPDEADRRA